MIYADLIWAHVGSWRGPDVRGGRQRVGCQRPWRTLVAGGAFGSFPCASTISAPRLTFCSIKNLCLVGTSGREMMMSALTDGPAARLQPANEPVAPDMAAAFAPAGGPTASGERTSTASTPTNSDASTSSKQKATTVGSSTKPATSSPGAKAPTPASSVRWQPRPTPRRALEPLSTGTSRALPPRPTFRIWCSKAVGRSQ